MKFLSIFGKFSVLKLFVGVIALPTIMVMIAVCNMQRENHEHKVTHEVFFDISIDGVPEGKIVFGLFGESVPLTVQNFYTFATTGFKELKYKNTRFHRVIKKFMIQGGDVVHNNGTGQMSIYGEDTFPDENFNIHHSSAGFLSMANSGKDTNSCQFFITTLATNWLNEKYVAFGKVIEGQSLVHKIEYMATDWNDRPLQHVVITRAGPRRVNKHYWISDDPYNLKDWVKTISFPLGMSFCIIFIFNHFIEKLDGIIDRADADVQIAKLEAEKMKKDKKCIEEVDEKKKEVENKNGKEDEIFDDESAEEIELIDDEGEVTLNKEGIRRRKIDK